MAPFRRGKSHPRGGFQSRRGKPVTGRNNRNGSRSGNAGAPFQASRVDETINNNSENSGAKSESEDSHEEAEESLSLEESSDSGSDPKEKPYNLLLQTLKPKAIPLGEPKRKRRKIEPVEVPTSLHAEYTEANGDLDGIQTDDEEAASEEDSADESGEDGNAAKLDYFTRHFADHDEQDTVKRMQAVTEKLWVAENSRPGASWSVMRRYPKTSQGSELNGHDNKSRPLGFKFKPKFEKAARELLSAPNEPLKQLSASVLSYQDVLFSARSLENAEEVRRLAGVHALNHVFRTRDRVLKNSARLSKIDHDEELEFRDQGFTRPKVLMLMPTRNSCVKMVDAIIALCEPEQQENKKRFQETFARVDDNFSPDKAEDFKDLFAGNDDDMFRLGLKFTRKAVKIFSHFYSSDIILASPLGLRTALSGDKKKKQDYDFVSSIEVVIVDQSEALLMQNWEHVEYIFEHLNLQSKEAHGCDFSRVRSWYLDGHARYFRQTVLLSAFNFPSLNRLYTQNMLNIDGKVKISAICNGAMIDMGVPIKQTFSRFEIADPASEPDDRFNYFTSAILPSLVKTSSQALGGQQGTLLFVPLYADFVRMRNYLASSSSTQNVSFGSISEYASVKEVARARSHFLTGRHSILLYTERAHHFRRYRLRGVKRVILYGLPENPLFYREIVGEFLGSSIAQAAVESHRTSVRCLFSKLDLLKLERIVGSERYLSLLSEKGDMFDFT
ncbi:MAG: hypothetical protein LQ344_005261 [Seirophora lacunosa]|nr:MAG: hypothetical protein LQ344_005261 [Seirophora lacunosa]